MNFKIVTDSKLCRKTVRNIVKQLYKEYFNEKDLFS